MLAAGLALADGAVRVLLVCSSGQRRGLRRPGGGAAGARHDQRAGHSRARSRHTGLRLGHNYIGTEHLPLGVLADEEGVGAKVLVALGFAKDKAEDWMLAQLAEIMKRQQAQ